MTVNFLLGRRMAEIRKRRRFTQEQLAAHLGRIGKRQLGNYETGRSVIPAELLVEVADILGCEASEFLKSPGSPITGWQARVTKPGKPQPQAADDMPAKENV